MASLKDVDLIEETQEAVKFFLEKSALVQHPKLVAKLKSFQREVHWE